MSKRLLVILAAVGYASATVYSSSLSASAASSHGQRVLADLPADRIRQLMDDFNRALGVECSHCHVPDLWADETKPAFGVARNMWRMVQAINENLLRDVGQVSCWTCHRGEVKPSRLPRPALEAELSRWPADLMDAPESQKLTMAVYNVSLGVACDHCHSSDWKRADKTPMKLVKVMSAMFAEFPKYMPPTARTQCFMCHKGSTKPQTQNPGAERAH